MKVRLEKVDDHLKEKLKNPYFRELYKWEQGKLSLVKRIIAYRLHHNLTQGDLAEKIGVTQQHISKIENCEFSSIPTLLDVLLYIGIRPRLEETHIKVAKRKRIRQVIRRTAHKLQTA